MFYSFCSECGLLHKAGRLRERRRCRLWGIAVGVKRTVPREAADARGVAAHGANVLGAGGVPNLDLRAVDNQVILAIRLLGRNRARELSYLSI